MSHEDDWCKLMIKCFIYGKFGQNMKFGSKGRYSYDYLIENPVEET